MPSGFEKIPRSNKVLKNGLGLRDRATMLAPAALLPTLVALQYGMTYVREGAYGSNAKQDEPDPLLAAIIGKENAPSQRMTTAFSRSGINGVPDPYVQLITGARYGRDAATSAVGPVFGTLANTADTFAKGLVANSNNTNTAERNMTRAFYDVVLSPAANLAASVFPVPLGAAALQANGSGYARDAFVDSIAGPKATPGGAHPFRAPRAPRAPHTSPRLVR